MYSKEIKKSMNYLAKQRNVIFIGQSVEYPGTFMSNTLTEVPKRKKIEMPVAEEMQLGITLGLAIEGYTPVSVIPRWNFMLYGMNQLVNHIDKFELMSDSKINNIIIRTGVGSKKPLNPQHQHIGNFSQEIKKMCKSINVISLQNSKSVLSEYKKAFRRKDKKITILVEYGDLYD
tara:strand:- start:149 stop:673 length:525 start_codon:yes stop_codon:yes gene_type:complete